MEAEAMRTRRAGEGWTKRLLVVETLLVLLEASAAWTEEVGLSLPPAREEEEEGCSAVGMSVWSPTSAAEEAGPWKGGS